MWTRKYLVVLTVIIAFASVGFYYGTRSEHDRMVDAQADHEHEDALIRATNVLAVQPANEAAKKVIRESGQIFVYLLAAQSTLSDFSAANEGLLTEPEKRYQNIERARALAAKAKALDTRFEVSVELDEMLDAAHTAVIHVLARNIIDDGQSTLVVAAAPYRKKSELIDSAASSNYLSTLLSVQSAWAAVEPSTDDIERQVNPRLDHMADTAGLVLTYQGGSAREVIKSLLAYIRSVKRSVAALSSGSGSYDDFATAANNTITDYQNAGRQLKQAMPTSKSVEQRFSSLIGKIDDYKIFQRDSSERIIWQNRPLYEN